MRLKRKVTKTLYLILVSLCLVLFSNLPDCFGQNANFEVFGVTDLNRIYEDGYNMPEHKGKVELFGIRKEYLSGQFVIHAVKDISDVTIRIGGLRNEITGKVIPSEHLNWNFVGSIPMSTDAPNQPKHVLERPAPANYPDYLKQADRLNLKSKKYLPVWLTVFIPVDSDEGEYVGDITITCKQGETSIPIMVRVYPLTLPDKHHLKIAEWYSTTGFSKFHGINEIYSETWFKMLRKYAENMAEHRQNVFQNPASSVKISKDEGGNLEFDFTNFDKVADIFWKYGKMDFMETGELFRFGKEGGWGGSEIVPAKFRVKVPNNDTLIVMNGENVLPALLPAIESHLRQRGWLDKTYFHVKDEPSLHNAKAYNNAASYVHKYAPDLKRMDAIETTDVLDNIEIAIPKLDAFTFWYPSFKEYLDKQKIELWFYTVGIFQASLLPNKTLDMPLMDSRLMHWLNYKYDATGYLHWGWNAWTDDPYEEVGKHLGDGWHVYPIKDGVLNSLRWEQMRNGIQDYEYFVMLEKKIACLKDSLGTRFSWIDSKQRGKEIANKVINNFWTRPHNSEVFYNAKREIVEEQLNLYKSPRVYVQTKPVEGSVITEGGGIEVSGWTEPATKIIVNNKEVSVSKEGLFLETFQLTKEASPEVIIKAIIGKEKREIHRKFSIIR